MGIRTPDPPDAPGVAARDAAVRPPVREVVLAALPVPLFLRSEQHADDVLRELVLMAQSRRTASLGSGAAELVRRAVAAVETLRTLRAETATAVGAAAERGEATITLRVAVAAADVAALADWYDVLAALAPHCRVGTMLAPPPDADVVRFRQWLVDEVARQSGGGTAQPWPASGPGGTG